MAGRPKRAGTFIPGLIGHWGFDQPMSGVQTLVLDASNSNFGGLSMHLIPNTVNAGAVLKSSPGIIKANGNFGLGIQGFGNLTAGSDRLRVNTARQWPQTGLTMSAWCYPNQAISVPWMIAAVYESATGAYMQFYLDGASPAFAIQQLRDVNYIERHTTGGIINNRWQHVVGTWNGGTTSSTSLRIYINSVRSDTTDTGTGTFTGPYTNADLRLEIGSQDVGNSPFLGLLDDVRMYTRALSQGEVTALWNEGYQTNGGIDQGFWPGIDGLGWTAPRAATPTGAASRMFHVF